MGTYTTSRNGVKKSMKLPFPKNPRCEYFWKIWSCSKCEIKTEEKLFTLHEGQGTGVGQGMACVGIGLGFSTHEKHCNKRMQAFHCRF